MGALVWPWMDPLGGGYRCPLAAAEYVGPTAPHAEQVVVVDPPEGAGGRMARHWQSHVRSQGAPPLPPRETRLEPHADGRPRRRPRQS